MIKRLLIAVVVLCAATGSLRAQNPTDSTTVVEEVSKLKDVPTLSAAWDPVLIDHSIGIRMGWGTGKLRREPDRESITVPYPLWNAGLVYRFDVPEQKYVGTMSFELQYVQKGYAYNYSYDGDLAYTQYYDMIEFSTLWQPYLPLGNGSRVFLAAGPFISYSLGSWEKEYTHEEGYVYSDQEYEMDSLNDYFWNYGIAVGGGFYFEFGRWGVTIDGRYTIQLSDLVRGPEYVTDNPFRTPVDHIGASVGVQYKFKIVK